MPIYQVTLTYLITIEGPIDAETAIDAATDIIQDHPGIYNDVYTEKVKD